MGGDPLMLQGPGTLDHLEAESLRFPKTALIPPKRGEQRQELDLPFRGGRVFQGLDEPQSALDQPDRLYVAPRLVRHLRFLQEQRREQCRLVGNQATSARVCGCGLAEGPHPPPDIADRLRDRGELADGNSDPLP